MQFIRCSIIPLTMTVAIVLSGQTSSIAQTNSSVVTDVAQAAPDDTTWALVRTFHLNIEGYSWAPEPMTLEVFQRPRGSAESLVTALADEHSRLRREFDVELSASRYSNGQEYVVFSYIEDGKTCQERLQHDEQHFWLYRVCVESERPGALLEPVKAALAALSLSQEAPHLLFAHLLEHCLRRAQLPDTRWYVVICSAPLVIRADVLGTKHGMTVEFKKASAMAGLVQASYPEGSFTVREYPRHDGKETVTIIRTVEDVKGRNQFATLLTRHRFENAEDQIIEVDLRPTWLVPEEKEFSPVLQDVINSVLHSGILDPP